MMQPGDAVMIAGKGHETGQIIKGVTHPFCGSRRRARRFGWARIVRHTKHHRHSSRSIAQRVETRNPGANTCSWYDPLGSGARSARPE